MQRRGIAEELAQHPRSLQRQLAAEGVRCNDIIGGERRAHAARYLAVPGLHLQQIAGLVGYSEQSALNRSLPSLIRPDAASIPNQLLGDVSSRFATRDETADHVPLSIESKTVSACSNGADVTPS
jgi:AraC-like DNA-binding protein